MDYLIKNVEKYNVSKDYIQFCSNDKVNNCDLNVKYYKNNEFNKRINELCDELKVKLEINLSYDKEITKVNNLRNASVLILCKCFNITNVNALNNTTILYLDYNKKVNDVSMLYNIKKLSLWNCNKIKDIGMLRTLESLTITTKMYGLHLLKKLKILRIYSKLMKGSMLQEINKLKKINKDLIVDVMTRVYEN